MSNYNNKLVYFNTYQGATYFGSSSSVGATLAYLEGFSSPFACSFSGLANFFPLRIYSWSNRLVQCSFQNMGMFFILLQPFDASPFFY